MIFQIYRDKKKDFRWRLLSKGRIIADSAEGYKRVGKCRRMVDRIKWDSVAATIEEE